MTGVGSQIYDPGEEGFALERPTPEQLIELAHRDGYELGSADALRIRELIDRDMLSSYDRLEQLAAAAPPVIPDRPSSVPAQTENPYGAWSRKVTLPSTGAGVLDGMKIAIKDNVWVAGVPMSNGSSLLAGFVPEEDATVVTRLLAAGAVIKGTATCEALCFSASSHTAWTGPVHNPRDPGRSAGGSSSGCAALIAAGEVDGAIGTDSGGSLRVPAAACGVFGLKPTFGLVPATHVFGNEVTLDHVGPMAGSARDVARILSVIAGRDGLDPRQQRDWPAVDYVASLEQDSSPLRIGILEEAFGHDGADPRLEAAVRSAAASFGSHDAWTVISVSVPSHRDTFDVFNVVNVEGMARLMIDGEGMGNNWRGRYAAAQMAAFGSRRRLDASQLPESVRVTLLAARWVTEQGYGSHYGMAQNLSPELAEAYDRALSTVDVLVMPTTPTLPHPLPAAASDIAERVQLALGSCPNTAQFDLTGHPAISVPCASIDGLPVGMMIVGRRGDDASVLRAAHTFETTTFKMPVAAALG
jgi:amidase